MSSAGCGLRRIWLVPKNNMTHTEGQATVATEAKPASSSERHGLTIIYTGNGKGKTSASLGLILRASAQGWRIAFLQFIKAWDFLSEHKTLRERFPEVKHELFGEGFVGILGDQKPKSAHKSAAQAGLAKAKEMMSSQEFDLVILDEILGTVTGGLIDEPEIIELLDQKPKKLHLVLTGRGATPAMVERADLVTEMKEVKHPYQQGILAQRGIDF